MSKKYTTNFLEDTNGSTGSTNQVLISTAAGIDWVDGSGSGIIGGPYVTIGTDQTVTGIKSFSGKIGADGGIDGLTLANGGITGSNYDITGVNQLVISDPGEGIVFTGTATMYLNAVDDATDSILKLTNATQLNLNSTARITSLVNPTGAQDAATKNYVDTEIGNIPSGLAFEGNWNASTDTPTLAGTTQDNGKFWIVSVAGTTDLSGITDWAVGDWAIYVDNGAGTDAWQKVDNSSTLSGLGAAGKVAFWSTTANVSFNTNFSYDGTNLTVPRLRVGDGTDGYFFSDSAGRTAFAGGDFYIQNNVANAYNYATNNYHGGASGDNQLFRGNPLTGDDWSITAAGAATFTTVTGTTGTFSADIFSGSTTKTTSNVIRSLAADTVTAGFEAYGANQGTGYAYVGQSASHGGGMFYNGDGTPAFATGETADRVSFYRRTNNANTVVFDYAHNSNTVNFKGEIYAESGSIVLGGTGRIQGVDTVTDSTDAANKAYVDTTTGAYLPLAGGVMTGKIKRSSAITGFLEGSYNNVGDNSANTNPIYTIGSSYNPASTTLSNMYGIGYTNGGNSSFITATGATGWGMYVAADGDSRVWLDGGNGNISHSGDLYVGGGDIVLSGTGRIQGVDTVSVSTDAANKIYVDSEIATRTPLNDIRSLGTTAFTNGANPNITTAQVMAEIDADGGFDSYSSVFKTSWSYAGNYNLTDAGDFTETAGSSWITWTDNSSDTVRGNITALAIAPNSGGSAGGVFIYNDQGSSYSPGWRQVWTNTTDGAGSGLDADLLDGQQGSYYASAASLGNYLPLAGGAMTGNIQMNNQIFATAGNYGRGVFGLYNASKYQHVWSMGTAYKLADNGASTGTGGNLYGLAWSYNPGHGGSGNNAQSKAGLNHQLLLMQNGTTSFAAGVGMWTSGNATIEGNVYAEGSVGIGTTNPGAKLEVNSNGFPQVRINDDVTGGEAGIRFKSFTGATNDLHADIFVEHSSGNETGRMGFRVPYTNERLTILSTGEVGIGHSTPTGKLDIFRTSTTYAVNRANTLDRAGLVIKSSGNFDSKITFSSGASSVQYIQALNNSATVGRDININPYGGNVITAGTMTATNFILSSDEKLKENIEKACDNRIKADWKTFELKTDKGQKRYGVIAQELEKTNPEFVREDTQGFKSVAYIDLLIAKIAELEARLEKAGI